MSGEHLQWWANLRHGGLLLDMQRLSNLLPEPPPPLERWKQERLRRETTAFQNDPANKRGRLATFLLEGVCNFDGAGAWLRGANVPASWTRTGFAGEALRPRQLWLGPNGAVLPVFVSEEKNVGRGRGKRVCSQALQWLRQGPEQLALVTNGQQWRVVFAGLDYDAFAEWDAEQWFSEGGPSPELDGFRALMDPALWTPSQKGHPCPLLAAVNDSRKGQAELSQALGERVRQATELLVQAHAPALNRADGLEPQDIYRAAVRMIMRLVVILFAESREGLLPRDNAVYHSAYSLQGLREQLERYPPGSRALKTSLAAYPRVLALMRLIREGCGHEAMTVPAYGGELFAPGAPDSPDGMERALHLMETACLGEEIVSDDAVRRILALLSRTEMRLRQGRSAVRVAAPVDFSSLDNEYIGILYEGLLDFELRRAEEGQPVVFLAVGDQPALPLETLEAMDDRGLKSLLEKLKDKSGGGDADEEGEASPGEGESDESEEEAGAQEEDAEEDAEKIAEYEEEYGDADDADDLAEDPRYALRARAEAWARRACEVGGLAKKPKGRMAREKRLAWEKALESKARAVVAKVVLPGEWYLVRWGGTRKGSGTFYTRPQLAVPTAHRTLLPLAYDPPAGADGRPDPEAPAALWTPKKPEDILALKVCDPACGSGSFCLAALRFLTDALYRSLDAHGRIRAQNGQSVLDLILGQDNGESLAGEKLPCRPDDPDFEVRTRAVLRRYVVERCIYGVDHDPLAVELCRLSLWIETLDRTLPLTFLNHKIKCGNTLVGAWFDGFLHYPAMAWEREGGDRTHANGVQFRKGQHTRAIRKRRPQVKDELILLIDGGSLFHEADLSTVRTVHDEAEQALRDIHALGVAQADERQERYEALRADPKFQRLKDAFDLWCALWFWPGEEIGDAPLPADFAEGKVGERASETAHRLAAELRFFHWELEFPDVFNADSGGFDAVLGNPPWDISKPNSKEFFSAVDPLYRGYGKQEAVDKQREYFRLDAETERRWLEYNAFFRAMSNWVKHAGRPFGDKVVEDADGNRKHWFNLGDRGRRSFATSSRRHERWKEQREQATGYADADHAFRHQGGGDINLYKAFLEQAHALLSGEGRLGLIVPSGLYSDHGTGALRRLLLEKCRWEWLFGFENREGIFDIHRSFKFNPVVVQKGGATVAVRTAFMRRDLADWERAERFATPYPLERVVQFSPRSRAILEIQSARDLEVLAKIYSNSVLLGDQGPGGWGIQYAREFDMTNDSRLFPPRPKWEEWGYRPDEYSRWIKGPWRPAEELWAQMGANPSRPAPLDAECAQAVERAVANGEAARTERRLRCAQPPYDRLPVPRANIPEGVILSREGDAYIREEDIPTVTFTDASGRALKIKVTNADGEREDVEVVGPAVGLPLYQGVMIYDLNPNMAGHIAGSGHRAKWVRYSETSDNLNTQFILPAEISQRKYQVCAIGFRALARTTDQRTFVPTFINGLPCGNSVGLFHLNCGSIFPLLYGTAISSSLPFDWALRKRIVGTNVNVFFMWESTWPKSTENILRLCALYTARVCVFGSRLAPINLYLECGKHLSWRSLWAWSQGERIRIRSIISAISLACYGLSISDSTNLIAECDHPVKKTTNIFFTKDLDPKGFWRVDKDKPPEHRHTVLTLVAFHDLQEKIAECGGDAERGIEAFCAQNGGEGWMLPETLRLADYGLGHDERAKERQPVRACFGPRFYDWQLAQTAEESWRECRLHARNLLGPEGYQALLDEIGGNAPSSEGVAEARTPYSAGTGGKASALGQTAFLMAEDIEDTPLFRKNDEGV